jgi:hypothetical protein
MSRCSGLNLAAEGSDASSVSEEHSSGFGDAQRDMCLLHAICDLGATVRKRELKNMNRIVSMRMLMKKR